LRAAIAAAATVVAAVIASIISPPPLRVIWNTTASTTIGLYLVSQTKPARGDLLVVRLPREMELLAVTRGLVAHRTPVLKPVAAIVHDRVCRFDSVISINGRVAAIARRVDQQGRPLPAWRGCRRLAPSQVFLLARHPHSFDSRYFGPVGLHLARGIARPLLTFAN
jgi:conjugative transfer signal peptidase TraF